MSDINAALLQRCYETAQIAHAYHTNRARNMRLIAEKENEMELARRWMVDIIYLAKRLNTERKP